LSPVGAGFGHINLNVRDILTVKGCFYSALGPILDIEIIRCRLGESVLTEKLLKGLTWPLQEGRFSGFSFADGVAGAAPRLGFGGVIEAKSASPEIEEITRFDLASLTKVYTATIAAILHTDGAIDLEAPLSSWATLSQELGQVTSLELLTHSSGLPSEWAEQASRQATIDELLSLKPSLAQRGDLLYSCTGYGLFSVALEQHLGMRFDLIVSKYLLDPLGLSETSYRPDEADSLLANSHESHFNKPYGLVHDPRARAMDGVSGNAGLFASANDVFLFLEELASGDKKVVSGPARDLLFRPMVSGEWQQALGLRYLDSERLGDQDFHFSHSGFTGTLAMIDPETKHIAVLLTNRLSCETTPSQMAEVYRAFASSVSLAPKY